MIKKIILFKILIIVFLFVTKSHAINIATIKIDYIINNVDNYKIFLNELNKKKQSIDDELRNKENILLKEKKDIEDSELILSSDEISIRLSEYDIKVNNFKEEINSFNSYFSQNIDINRNLIINQIIEIVKNISKDNFIDLIIDERNYFLSSDKIDVSLNVIEIINQRNINFNLLELKDAQ